MAKKQTKFRFMKHDNGRKLLFELDDVMKECSIPFFLIQGTALGAHRDNGFTSTEGDIDFGVLWEDFAGKQSYLVKTLTDRHFEVRTISRPFTRIRSLVAWKYGEHADIVSFIPWKGLRFVARPLDERNLPRYSIVHSASLIDMQKPIYLFSRRFLAPFPIESYLKLEYGDDWRTPRHDHESRTRRYDFVEKEGIPLNILETEPPYPQPEPAT